MARKAVVNLSKSQLEMYQKTYKTDIEIAKAVGVSRQWIYILRKKYNILPIKSKDVKINRNKAIYTSFMADTKRKELAHKHKVSYITICRIINKNKGEAC